MKGCAGRACDLARDKIAGGAFVKRACRRPPTGRAAMSATCALEGQQVTKSVIAAAPMLPYRGGISACACRVTRSNVCIQRACPALEDEKSNRCGRDSGSATSPHCEGMSPHCEGNTFDVRLPPNSGFCAAQLTGDHGRFAPSRQSFQLPQICRSPALPLASLLILLLSADH
jgi:hypothetical protein